MTYPPAPGEFGREEMHVMTERELALFADVQRLREALIAVPSNYVPAEEMARWIARAIAAEAEAERYERFFERYPHLTTLLDA